MVAPISRHVGARREGPVDRLVLANVTKQQFFTVRRARQDQHPQGRSLQAVPDSTHLRQSVGHRRTHAPLVYLLDPLHEVRRQGISPVSSLRPYSSIDVQWCLGERHDVVYAVLGAVGPPVSTNYQVGRCSAVGDAFIRELRLGCKILFNQRSREEEPRGWLVGRMKTSTKRQEVRTHRRGEGEGPTVAPPSAQDIKAGGLLS